MNTLLALLLLSSPLSWTDLAVGEKYVLSEKISVGANGPSYPAGTALQFESSEPLSIPGAPVLLLQFSEPNCQDPERKSDIEIVVPAGNPESSSVGIELSRGCQWGIYVEQKDLFQPSFFAHPGV